MAKCIRCGRALPAFSFGELKRTCKWCREYEAAQRGDEPEDAVQKVIAPPWVRNPDGISVTQVFLGINVLVFVCMAMAGISINQPTTQQLLNSGADSGYLVLSGQWWRLITSMFVHIGVIHIALNMWCLWDLGAMTEKMYGRWTFTILYLLCGVAGSLVSIVYAPMRVSAGASGAIFGLAGALISSYKLGDFSLPQSIVHASLRSVVAFAGYNLVLGTIMSRTNNAAHLGGLVAGLILGALLAVVAPNRDDVLQRVTILTLFALTLVAGAGWAQHSRSYAVHEERAQELIADSKYADAVRELEIAARQRPESIDIRMQLATAYSANGQHPQARQQFQEVVRLDPQHELAHYWLAMDYLTSNDLANAQKTLTDYLRRNDRSAMSHFGLGIIYSGSGNDLGAIKEFQTAAQINPEMNSVQLEMGNSYSKLKKYDEALAAYAREKDVDGDSSGLELAIAEAYDGKGMKNEAAEARKQAEKLKSEEAEETDD